jgi:hypothetical protein
MIRAKEQTSFRIDFKILSILLLAATAPLLVGAWWLFSSFENAYLEMVGANLSQAADTALGQINSYLQNQIIQIAGIAESPTVREVVARNNGDLKRDLEAVRKAIPKLEAEWPTLKSGDPKIRDLMESPASKFLSRYTAVNRSYLDIVVTDFLGRVVAANRRPAGYYYATRDWWKEAYGDGIQGSVYIGDANFDRNSGSFVMELAQPIVEPQGGVIGEIKAMLGIQSINTIIGSFRAAPGATAVLMRSKGEVISAPGYNPFEWRTYPPTLEILLAREKGRAYFISNAEPKTIYGLAQTNLKQLYPNLNWMLVTTGTVSDVLGPLERLRRYFIYLVMAVILASVTAAVLLSRAETRPLLEQDPHLEKL